MKAAWGCQALVVCCCLSCPIAHNNPIKPSIACVHVRCNLLFSSFSTDLTLLHDVHQLGLVAHVGLQVCRVVLGPESGSWPGEQQRLARRQKHARSSRIIHPLQSRFCHFQCHRSLGKCFTWVAFGKAPPGAPYSPSFFFYLRPVTEVEVFLC